MATWTKPELELAKLMYETGHNYEEIAECLERPYSSVSGKLWRVYKDSEGTPQEVISNFKINQDPEEMDNPQLELDEDQVLELEPDGKYHDDILLMIRKADLMMTTLDDAYQSLKSVRRHNDYVVSLIDSNRLRILECDQNVINLRDNIKAHIATSIALNVITLGALAWITLS